MPNNSDFLEKVKRYGVIYVWFLIYRSRWLLTFLSLFTVNLPSDMLSSRQCGEAAGRELVALVGGKGIPNYYLTIKKNLL